MQIINKPEPRKVEHLTEEEKLERQVWNAGICITHVMQGPLLVLDVSHAHMSHQAVTEDRVCHGTTRFMKTRKHNTALILLVWRLEGL